MYLRPFNEKADRGRATRPANDRADRGGHQEPSAGWRELPLLHSWKKTLIRVQQPPLSEAVKGGGTTSQASTPAWQDCVHSRRCVFSQLQGNPSKMKSLI